MDYLSTVWTSNVVPAEIVRDNIAGPHGMCIQCNVAEYIGYAIVIVISLAYNLEQQKNIVILFFKGLGLPAL